MELLLLILAFSVIIYLLYTVIKAIKANESSEAQKYAILLGVYVILTTLMFFGVPGAALFSFSAWHIYLLIVLLAQLWQVIIAIKNGEQEKIKTNLFLFTIMLICAIICVCALSKIGIIGRFF